MIENYLPLLARKYSELYLFGIESILRKIQMSTGSSIKDTAFVTEKSDRLVYRWIRGERPISLKDLQRILNLLKNKNDKDWWKLIFDQMTYVSAGYSKKVILPKNLSNDLLYFLGSLSGDGCISTDRKTISISGDDRDYLNFLASEVNKLFKTRATIIPIKNYYVVAMYSRAIVAYFDIVWNFPIGKKDDFGSLIRRLKELPLKLQLLFCSGFLDTDGGTLTYEGILKGNKPYFEVAQSKKDILTFIKDCLSNVGISLKGPHNYPIKIKGEKHDRWRIRTDNIEDLKKLRKFIRHPDKAKRLELICAPVAQRLEIYDNSNGLVYRQREP